MSGRALGRAAAAAALTASALAMAGCVGLRDVGASQPGVLGDVQVTGTVCVSATPECPGARGNSDTAVNEGDLGQVLVGYRVPAAAAVPAAVAAPGLAFARSPGYEAELQRLAPAPAGSRWAGYVSDPVAFTAARDAGGRAVAARFGLPVTPGAAFEGPFRYRPVVGARGVTAAAPASRPVACGPSLTTAQPDGDTAIVCADAPAPADLGADLAAPVQDLVVVAAADRVAATPGTVAVVPFTLRNGGRGAKALQLSLSAATTLPGGAVAPSPSTLVPAPGGDHQALVVVGVPASAARAIHGVTLRATAPGGAVREMTTRLVVGPRPAAAATRSRAPRRVRLDWRSHRRASFYNLQLFRNGAKVVSLFPGRSERVVRLRPGRYRMIVWTGLARRPSRYMPRALVNRAITVRAVPPGATRR